MKNEIKTCFVIIGYGPKMDYASGRELNMDKTFDYIIKPAFEELGFLCYRASDISHSGIIDIAMYENILKSDFVVADLSTLNPNVLYELGIRHAVRKNTTIIIAEHELKYPFDLNHIVIEPYEHLGKAIDYGEVIRFKNLLKHKIQELEKSPKTDSPLYSFFPDLEIPRFTADEVKEIQENIHEEGSLSDYMSLAEEAKNLKDYPKALEYLKKALALKQDNVLVTQRLALVTYKSEHPNKIEALNNALEIIEDLKPLTTTDIETLGLSGAIYKRLYEIENNYETLKKSIWFYEKGFYIANDYYNGINLAYLFNINALLEKDKIASISSYGNAVRIRQKVKEICEMHLHSKSWETRDDKEWIFLTLAEIAFASGNFGEEEMYINQIKKLGNIDFAVDSYYSQREKLKKLINDFQANI